MMCDDMGSIHSSLLLHTTVRWLSRGKCLAILFEMRAEVRTFLIGRNFALGDRLCNEHWLIKLAYLIDIFNKVNKVLTSGKDNNFNANDKIQAYRKKLIFWAESVKNKNLDSNPLITEFRE